MGMIHKLNFNKKILLVENIFLIMAILFGVAITFIGTPLQECDGWEHFIRSMDVSYGNLFAPIVDINHGSGMAVVSENFEEINYMITQPGSGEGTAYKEYLKTIKLSKTGKTIGFHGGFASIFYYPQAIGLFIGRLFGFNLYNCIILGKIMNLFVFLIFTYCAIKITPVLKNTIVVIALLPMTLYQAASFSYDAMLNGMCLLFVALCFYYAYSDKKKINVKESVCLGMLLSFIFLCKYVYVCLGLLVFLIPKEKFGDKKEYYKKFGLALIPIVLLGIFAVYSAFSTISAGQSLVSESISDGSIVMSPLNFLLSSPLNVIKVLLSTFFYKFSDYVLWLDVLGSLNYSLGPLIYIVPMFILYVIGSEVSDYSYKIKTTDKVICAVAFIITSISIVLGIYIGDTRINFAGEFVVQGVQGRYFIPTLSALAFAIVPRNRTNENKYFVYMLWTCEFVILCITIYFLRSNCY